MANPLAIALALYGGYKGYKAGKERGGTRWYCWWCLGAAGGYYGGQYLGGKLMVCQILQAHKVLQVTDGSFSRRSSGNRNKAAAPLGSDPGTMQD
jgi:hypothetical protein